MLDITTLGWFSLPRYKNMAIPAVVLCNMPPADKVGDSSNLSLTNLIDWVVSDYVTTEALTMINSGI